MHELLKLYETPGGLVTHRTCTVNSNYLVERMSGKDHKSERILQSKGLKGCGRGRPRGRHKREISKLRRASESRRAALHVGALDARWGSRPASSQGYSDFRPF